MTVATEVVPQPYFVEAVVIADSGNRLLYVKRPETVSGYGLLLWRECHMALVQAQESGWRTGHETVWAGVDLAHNVKLSMGGAWTCVEAMRETLNDFEIDTAQLQPFLFLGFGGGQPEHVAEPGLPMRVPGRPG